MKDRLNDLREIQDVGSPEIVEIVIDIDAEETYLGDFFAQIGQIQQTFYDLKEKFQEIKTKHVTIITAPLPEDQVKKELEQLITDVQSMMSGIKLNLQKMDKNIKVEEGMNHGNVADIAIKKCQYATLSRELVDAMTEYDTIQYKYKENCKNRIKRQFQIVNPDTPALEDAAFEEMMENDNLSIFTQGIITETQQGKDSLLEIEARHNDIIKLEISIKELHELFTDVALFVASQGEMIDSIEYNVEHAKIYVEEAKDEITKALVYQTKSRKKKIFVCVLCFILLLIIAVAIYFGVKH